MTGAGFLLILALFSAWLLSSYWMRRTLLGYKAEIRRLKDASVGLEGHRAAGQHHDRLFSAINEAVIKLDGKAKLIAANPRARELFDIGDANISQSLVLFYRDSDWHDGLSRAFGLLPEVAELEYMHVSGRVLAPRLAKQDDGEYLLLCVDITEQHRLDQQRRTFLSNLMHDLKTPLTSLLGYARSLEKFGDDADFRKEAVHVIADEAKHVNHLLDALLTLDQIEFAAKGENEVCEPAQVLGQACEMLKPLCKAKKLKLSFKNTCDDGQLLAISDNDLDRVVTNLLSNAVNHSPKRGKIQLSTLLEKQQLHIVVEDQGEGIPEKELSRVTERFYRVDKARTRNATGHGLGLAIVKELVEKNDGVLILSNLDPQGLRAEIRLPVATGSEA